MRYAIVSDIHANFEAWKTVLKDIADMKADKIICLGDVVGYGPNPVEVLESVYRIVENTVMGNHDAALCGIADPNTFSPRAKTAVLRHREQISQAGLSWLRSLPAELALSGFRCTHGDFSAPKEFRYIISPEEALPSWAVTQEQLLFVGHSHLPGIYVIGASGVPHFVEPCDFELENGKRYIVNPGSVGYPRAGDFRSSYCLFDDGTKALSFRQLPFDCEEYRKRLKAAGLGDDPWLKDEAPQQHLPWLREQLSFGSPSASINLHAQDLREHGRLDLREKKKHSLLISIALLSATASLAFGGYAVYAHRHANESPLAITVPVFELPSLNAYPLVPADKNLLPELPTVINSDGRMPGWRYAFDDRTQQSFHTGLRDGATTLLVRNADICKIKLETPLINLAGTQLHSLRLRGQIGKQDAFSGTVFYQLVTYTTQPDDTITLGATYSFEVRDAKGKTAPSTASLSRKIELSKRTSYVRFRIDATFKGTLEIQQALLTAETRKAAENKPQEPVK